LNSKISMLALVTTAVALMGGVAYGQGPGPGGGGRGGRGGGLPGATAEQMQAVADMNTALSTQISAVTASRAQLASATFGAVKDDAAIRGAVEKLREAELALATKRAEEFAKLQAGPNKLTPEQVAALIATGGNPAAGRGGRGGGPPPAGAGRGN
jgi:Spy/CpxP family protein refolding chaperone